jgi:hypothetical protein
MFILNGRNFERVEACAASDSCAEMVRVLDEWHGKNVDIVRMMSGTEFRDFCDILVCKAIKSDEEMSKKLHTLVWDYGATLDFGRMTHLARAVLDRQPNVVRALLLAGANVKNTETVAVIPSFFGQARNDKMEELLTILLDAGFDINRKDRLKGETMLHFAARAGHAEIVSLLLNRGARTNMKTHHIDGLETALHSAVYNRYPTSTEVIKLLLYGGEDSRNKNRDGLTAMQILKSSEHVWPLRALSGHEIVTNLANIRTMKLYITDRREAVAYAEHPRLGNRRDCYLGCIERELRDMIFEMAGLSDM